MKALIVWRAFGEGKVTDTTSLEDGRVNGEVELNKGFGCRFLGRFR
jgi:hypothetical protein